MKPRFVGIAASVPPKMPSPPSPLPPHAARTKIAYRTRPFTSLRDGRAVDFVRRRERQHIDRGADHGAAADDDRADAPPRSIPRRWWIVAQRDLARPLGGGPRQDLVALLVVRAQVHLERRALQRIDRGQHDALLLRER